MSPVTSAARRLYRPLELVHVVGYFAPETTQAYLDAGLTDYGMGYFASRSAPMGGVPAEVTVATFYVFAPRLVAQALPKAWSLLSPEEVIEARYRGIEAALRRGLGEQVAGPGIQEAAQLARSAVVDLDVAGRPLCAGNTRLDWPEDPALALWQAATILREHRGDGHVAAVLTAGLDPVEALVNAASTGGPRKFLKSTRGWTPEEWAAAEDRLQDRGLLDAEGNATDDGLAVRTRIEEQTDAAAEAPYRRLGEERQARLRDLLWPLGEALRSSGLLPSWVTGR